MLIEKSKNKEELIDSIGIIIKTSNNEEILNKLATIVEELLSNYIKEKSERREENMSTLYYRILDENKEILKAGEKNGEIKNQKRIVKNMINKKLKDEIILETTGIDKVELQKIKIESRNY